MSLRAELVRLGTRAFIKHRRPRNIPVAVRRHEMQAYERWVPRPPSSTLTVRKPLGGIPAVRVSGPERIQSRHILFLHGGGYITGSTTLYRHITWRIAAAAKACVAAIDYRLAPEHPFPAALDDAMAAWKALMNEGVPPGQCAFVGDSAGGGLALSLALRLRDERIPLPGSIVALSPWTDLAMTGQSDRSADDPMLNFNDLAPLARNYLCGADARNPYASPLYGDPVGLPPTLLQVGSDEILYDDSARMAQRMRERRCEVTFEVWPRMPHVWHAFAPVMPEARQAIRNIGAFVSRHVTES